jgi:hypothetical protein
VTCIGLVARASSPAWAPSSDRPGRRRRRRRGSPPRSVSVSAALRSGAARRWGVRRALRAWGDPGGPGGPDGKPAGTCLGRRGGSSGTYLSWDARARKMRFAARRSATTMPNHPPPAASEASASSPPRSAPAELPWLHDLLRPAVCGICDLGVGVFLPTPSSAQDLALLLQGQAVPRPAWRHETQGSWQHRPDCRRTAPTASLRTPAAAGHHALGGPATVATPGALGPRAGSRALVIELLRRSGPSPVVVARLVEPPVGLELTEVRRRACWLFMPHGVGVCGRRQAARLNVGRGFRQFPLVPRCCPPLSFPYCYCPHVPSAPDRFPSLPAKLQTCAFFECTVARSGCRLAEGVGRC